MKKISTYVSSIVMAAVLLACTAGVAQTLTPDFVAAGYTLTDLGSVNLLPTNYGGLTIRPEEPNTLYIGGSANTPDGAIYTVALTRDPVNHHITGFAGDAVLYVAAPHDDGGLIFAPNGTLLFTRYNVNHLGQILPDNTYVTTLLTDYGISSSVGSVALVPAGYPGAGNLIIASYNAGILYHVPYTISGTGQYMLYNQVAEVSVAETVNGPEGIAYIPAGSPGFPNLSLVISGYRNGKVVVFEVGPGGLPLISTSRDMIIGLSGAEGAVIDPLTGDFLFSTFGGGNKIIRVTGFSIPNGTGNELPQPAAGLSVYPIPARDFVKVESKTSITGSAEIINVHGQVIAIQEVSGKSNFSFDLSSLPAGMYYLRVKNGDAVISRKIQKEEPR